MTFSYVDLNTISDEEYEYLLSINEWINKEPQTQVYVVKDHNDIKSVFCLKQDWNYTGLELCFGTKEKEQNNGYCTFGFYMILEIIKNNPSIKGVLIDSINSTTALLCKKLKILETPYNMYYFYNSNFNSKYDELEKMIIDRTPLEEIVEFCGNDEIMLGILDIWMAKSQEKNKRLINR